MIPPGPRRVSGRSGLAWLTLAGLLLFSPVAESGRRPVLIVRPVSVPADTFPGRAGTLGFKVYNGGRRPLRLRRVAQTKRAPCRVQLIPRRLNVKLRPHRWTTIRLRRAVRMHRDAPNSCQGRVFRIRLRVTATG